MNQRHAERMVAKKYAVAFYNIWGSTLTKDTYQALGQLQDALNTHQRILGFLQLSCLDHNEKMHLFALLMPKETPLAHVTALMDYLLTCHRGFLIPIIVSWIIELYQQAHSITSWNIITPHAVSPEIMESVLGFIEHKTQTSVIPQVHVDKTLLAGIRLQSDELLWEYSVKKQLTILRHSLSREGL